MVDTKVPAIIFCQINKAICLFLENSTVDMVFGKKYNDYRTILLAAYASTSFTHTDSTVIVFTPDLLERVFSARTVNGARYRYSLLPDETSSMACVQVDFELDIGDEQYQGSAFGTIDRLTVGNFVIWKGSLYGTSIIDNKENGVIVNFIKEDNSDKVQLAITISVSIDNTIYDILIGVGDSVLSQEIIQINESNLISTENTFNETSNNKYSTFGIGGNLPNVPDDGTTPSYDGYVLQVYRSILEGSPSKIMMGSSVYFRSFDNTVAVCIHSKCTNVNSTHELTNAVCATTVRSLKYQLSRNAYTSSSASYIAGVEFYDFGISNVGKKDAILIGLFQDILSIFDVPTSTITAVFDTLRGKVSETKSTDLHIIEIDIPFAYSRSLDALANGVPIVFQLSRSGGSYVGNSEYTVTVEIEYETAFTYTTVTDPDVYYFTTRKTIETGIEIDLS